MTSARANLTQLLRDVRYGKRTGAFTERGDRSAYVVPPEDYAEIAAMREVRDRLARLESSGKPDDKVSARVIREALEDAARRTSDT